MAQKIINVAGIGPVTFVKRRGTKNLRLSIRPDGKVRVGLPPWAPYATAERFVINRADWVNQALQHHRTVILRHGHSIGKSHRLQLIYNPAAKRTYSQLTMNSIVVTSPLVASHPQVQAIATRASERALRLEAEKLLAIKLKNLAQDHKLTYKEVRIKRLSSRWGSCSDKKVITLSYFLMQLPWPVIEYVLAHELAHTELMNHSREFWALVEKMVPDAKIHRKEINKYHPIVLPGTSEPVA